ncbi:hypothetical protein AAHE18_05G026700 [Arachis hypogaea]
MFSVKGSFLICLCITFFQPHAINHILHYKGSFLKSVYIHIKVRNYSTKQVKT